MNSVTIVGMLRVGGAARRREDADGYRVIAESLPNRTLERIDELLNWQQ